MKDKELREYVSYNDHGYDICNRLSKMVDEIYTIRHQLRLLADHLGVEFQFRESLPKVQLIKKEENS